MRAVVLIAVFIVSGCGTELTPEEQLRNDLESMEAAAENRDLGELMDFVSENYVDEDQRSRKEIRQIAQAYLLRNKNLHIYQHITQLDITGSEFADVIVYVALAGSPIESPQSLASMRADLVRFRVRLVREDTWRVVSANWQRASAGDFL